MNMNDLRRLSGLKQINEAATKEEKAKVSVFVKELKKTLEKETKIKLLVKKMVSTKANPYITVTVKDRDGDGDVIPNDLRVRAVMAVYGTIANVNNKNDISFGNISDKEIIIQYHEWLKVVGMNESLTEAIILRDSILSGITFGELVDTVQANEPVVDSVSVMRVYNRILKTQLDDAEYELKSKMKDIIKAVK